MHEIHTVAREDGKLKFVPVTTESSESLVNSLKKLYPDVGEKLIEGINNGKIIAFCGKYNNKPHFVLGVRRD